MEISQTITQISENDLQEQIQQQILDQEQQGQIEIEKEQDNSAKQLESKKDNQEIQQEEDLYLSNPVVVKQINSNHESECLYENIEGLSDLNEQQNQILQNAEGQDVNDVPTTTQNNNDIKVKIEEDSSMNLENKIQSGGNTFGKNDTSTNIVQGTKESNPNTSSNGGWGGTSSNFGQGQSSGVNENNSSSTGGGWGNSSNTAQSESNNNQQSSTGGWGSSSTQTSQNVDTNSSTGGWGAQSGSDNNTTSSGGWGASSGGGNTWGSSNNNKEGNNENNRGGNGGRFNRDRNNNNEGGQRNFERNNNNNNGGNDSGNNNGGLRRFNNNRNGNQNSDNNNGFNRNRNEGDNNNRSFQNNRNNNNSSNDKGTNSWGGGGSGNNGWNTSSDQPSENNGQNGGWGSSTNESKKESTTAGGWISDDKVEPGGTWGSSANESTQNNDQNTNQGSSWGQSSSISNSNNNSFKDRGQFGQNNRNNGDNRRNNGNNNGNSSWQNKSNDGSQGQSQEQSGLRSNFRGGNNNSNNNSTFNNKNTDNSGGWGNKKDKSSSGDGGWNTSDNDSSALITTGGNWNSTNNSQLKDKGSLSNQQQSENLANNEDKLLKKRQNDPRLQGKDQRTSVGSKMDEMTEMEVQERIFGSKRLKKNEKDTSDDCSELFKQKLTSYIDLENDDDDGCFVRFSPTDDRDKEYHPTGISLTDEINEGSYMKLVEKNKIVDEEEEDGDYLFADPQKMKDSQLKKYQIYSGFFNQYRNYLIPKSEYSIGDIQQTVTYNLFNDRLIFVLPDETKRYNLLVQFNTYMNYDEFRFLPLISTRNRVAQSELGFLNYDSAIDMIKNIHIQDTKERRTIFPCWVESQIPNQHQTLNKLANYLLEKNLIAGFNFTNHATINLMHVKQVFPDLEYIDLPEQSENQKTSLICFNTLEATIYDSFCQKIPAYE